MSGLGVSVNVAGDTRDTLPFVRRQSADEDLIRRAYGRGGLRRTTGRLSPVPR